MDDGFVVTKEYRRFAEFCDACRRDRYIGLCFGQPGVGKTASARHYASSSLVEAVIDRHLPYAESDVIDPDAATGTTRSIVYTPTVTVSPRHLQSELTGLAGSFSRLSYDSPLRLAVRGRRLPLSRGDCPRTHLRPPAAPRR